MGKKGALALTGKVGWAGKKQKAWLRAFLDAKDDTTFNNATAAVLSVDSTIPKEVAKRLGMALYKVHRSTIETYLDEFFLSDRALKGKLTELMNGKSIKVFCNKGEIVYSEPIPDLELQRRCLDMALKIKGAYAPERQKVDINVSLADLVKDFRENTIDVTPRQNDEPRDHTGY